MAIQHYQFEAIHPFPDGNGRTGRILNILGLIQDGLLDRPTLYLSRYVLNTRANYYRLLGRVTSHGEWEPWILYMLAAVEETSQWTTLKIKAVRALMNETVAYVRTAAPKTPHAVIELIFKQPYVRIGDICRKQDRGARGRVEVPTRTRNAWYPRGRERGATRSSCTASISTCCSATSTLSRPIQSARGQHQGCA